MVRKLLHLEGLAVFIASLYFYNLTQGNWWMFILLVLTPDISMIGYLKNKRLGASIYNIFHTYTLAILLLFIGTLSDTQFITELGIIFTAHIGMDRFFGYGLKYPTNFKDTHLQKA